MDSLVLVGALVVLAVVIGYFYFTQPPCDCNFKGRSL